MKFQQVDGPSIMSIGKREWPNRNAEDQRRFEAQERDDALKVVEKLNELERRVKG